MVAAETVDSTYFNMSYPLPSANKITWRGYIFEGWSNRAPIHTPIVSIASSKPDLIRKAEELNKHAFGEEVCDVGKKWTKEAGVANSYYAHGSKKLQSDLH